MKKKLKIKKQKTTNFFLEFRAFRDVGIPGFSKTRLRNEEFLTRILATWSSCQEFLILLVHSLELLKGRGKKKKEIFLPLSNMEFLLVQLKYIVYCFLRAGLNLLSHFFSPLSS